MVDMFSCKLRLIKQYYILYNCLHKQYIHTCYMLCHLQIS